MSQRLDLVRTEVRRLLEQSPAFEQLDPQQRASLSTALVKVGDFLADPAWLGQRPPPELGAEAQSSLDKLRDRVAFAQDAAEDVGKRLAQKPGQVGQEFKAGAGHEGVDLFDQMVKTVDFPEFVSGLISGVFEAVVKASIEQMHAYGEMMSAVVKSIDSFAKENITEGAARDAVASRYPDAIAVVATEGGARLRWREGLTEQPNLAADYGIAQSVDLEDEEGEARLMAAARLELARSKQQLLATMVLLGINRIVVTNGKINARVLFDMKASDKATRVAKASMIDEKSKSASAGGFAISPWGGGGASASTKHKTTVQSSIDDTSESSTEVKAQLAGEVSLAFKSETFPLEKLATPEGMAFLQNRAQPINPPGMTAAAGAPPAAGTSPATSPSPAPPRT